LKLPEELWNSPKFSYTWNNCFNLGEYAIWCKVNSEHEIVYKVTEGDKPDEAHPGNKYIGGLLSNLHAHYEEG